MKNISVAMAIGSIFGGAFLRGASGGTLSFSSVAQQEIEVGKG